MPSVQDSALALQVSNHDHGAFELLMRRYNTRLFRAARAILKNDAEAEDALQDAYLEAYRHMGEFRGDAQLSTWLTRIVVTRALMRLRKEKRHRNVVSIDSRETPDGDRLEADVKDDAAEPPAETVWRGELRKLIEQRVDELPLPFRTVFVLREIEDMTAAETADALGIPEATVRSRHFRARAMLRASIARDVDVASADAFSFDGERCDRIVGNVLARLRIEYA